MLEDDLVVLSSNDSCRSVGVSLLVKHSLNAIVNLVFADDGSRLVMVDVAVKSFKFRMAAIYEPNIAAERVSFFRWLAPFLDDLKRLFLVGDWNVILDHKKDRVRWGARVSETCESSAIDLMARHDLVDRFRLNHLLREIWT